MSNQGFTLVEVLVAMSVLAIGLLGVAAMQTMAIGTNSAAKLRTNANAMALSVMEGLQRIDYDNPLLDDGAGANDGNAGLDDGMPPPNGNAVVTADGFPDITVTLVDHSILDAGFLANFPLLNNNTYRIVGAGAQTRLVDETNGEYLLFYNVNDDPWGDGSEAFSIVRMFVFWRSPKGGISHIELTTTKYNNT